MTSGRCNLIVNADDFGLSPGVNAGIIEAHEHGIVTSASLMVRWPAAEQAAAYARRHLSLGVGLHLDLGEWHFDEGEWRPVYEVVPLQDSRAIAREVASQLDAFRALVGREPDHIDSHQHVHRREPVRSAATALADGLGVPLRHFSKARYCGEFYGQTTEGRALPGAVSAPALVAILETLDDEALVELCCHPGYSEGLRQTGTMYRAERLLELGALCESAVQRAIARLAIQLCTFGSCCGRPAEASGRKASPGAKPRSS
jgi:chitin disaccharide deacetylase